MKDDWTIRELLADIRPAWREFVDWFCRHPSVVILTVAILYGLTMYAGCREQQ